eukprot:Sro686_g187140.2  (440) ;mRNA; r:40993-42312
MNRHAFVGRVGTIATVTYTHGDAVLDNNNNNNNPNNSSRVWQQHAEQQGELILQAVGTTRFRVQQYIDFQSFADVQVFRVQPFRQDDRPLVNPTGLLNSVIRRKFPAPDPALIDTAEFESSTDEQSFHHHLNTGNHSTRRRSSKMARIHPATTIINSKYAVSHHESLIRHLALVTPTPHLAYRKVWPWGMVGRIVETIQASNNNNQQSSLLTSLAELLRDPETATLMDHPTAFSFWMASQMPLSVKEKYHLLQLPTTVERLVKLQQHLTEYTSSRPTAICCKACRIPLSTVDCVFTVGGAEGTTGNYVNEHGFIHQVVTLRQVEDEHRKVYCAGGASTENSYFPGYSWTITYCARCGSLLGWKFHWVGLEEDQQNDNAAMEEQETATAAMEEETATTMTGRSRRRRSSRRQSHHSANRPPSFYGFMSSSLITDQSVDVV